MMEKADEAIEELVGKHYRMIKNIDAMVPKKKGGPLDVDTALEQKSDETMKIMGMTNKEVMPNKMLDRLREFKIKEE